MGKLKLPMQNIELQDKYDRIASAYFEDNMRDFVRLGVFDGIPDNFFLRHAIPALGEHLRQNFSEPKRPRGRPKKVTNE